MLDSESPDMRSSRIRADMKVTNCILLLLLAIAYPNMAAEESPPDEPSQSETSTADVPSTTSEKSVEAESREEPLDTFVPSEQVSPDSSISFPVDI